MNSSLKIVQIRPEILKLVKANDGYCPCTIERNPDTKCICKAFWEQDKPGECHCGRFAKVYGEDTDVPTEWIPASEPPKEPGEYIVAKKNWLDGHLESSEGRWNGADWLVDGTECLMVSHWMPLPEPPKGEQND